MNDLKSPRAWHKKLKRMGEVDTITWAGGKLQGIRCGAFNYYSRDEVVLLKPTGLQDKNGKEIYEGDICKNGDWVEDAHAYNYRTEEVMWDRDGAGWIGWNFNENGMTCEVIGNVYENPDLLKEAK